MQMLWLFIVGFLCAIYELLIGFVGIFFFDINQDIAFDYDFIIKCEKGYWSNGHLTVWDAKDSQRADLFITLHTVVIIMWSMIHFIVFFTIPYKYNRILKTDEEIEAEIASKRKRAKKRKVMQNNFKSSSDRIKKFKIKSK